MLLDSNFSLLLMEPSDTPLMLSSRFYVFCLLEIDLWSSEAAFILTTGTFSLLLLGLSVKESPLFLVIFL